MSLVPERSQRARIAFTERLITVCVPNHPLLAKAFRAVDRAQFIPSYLKHLRPLAYKDEVIPLQDGASISQPSLVAKMLRNLHVDEGQRVLEIGTASGYQAALLSEIVGPTGEVHTIEIDHTLAEHATRALHTYHNVYVHETDGTGGLPELGPFDRIIVTAQGTEVPVALREQLAVYGYLLMPVGNQGEPQHLIVLQKLPNDEWYAETLSGAVSFVPLQTPSHLPQPESGEVQHMEVRESAHPVISDEKRRLFLDFLTRRLRRGR